MCVFVTLTLHLKHRPLFVCTGFLDSSGVFASLLRAEFAVVVAGVLDLGIIVVEVVVVVVGSVVVLLLDGSDEVAAEDD